jgi:hypothetical protein
MPSKSNKVDVHGRTSRLTTYTDVNEIKPLALFCQDRTTRLSGSSYTIVSTIESRTYYALLAGLLDSAPQKGVERCRDETERYRN